MAYHRFTDDQGNAYGSFEVFSVSAKEARHDQAMFNGPGWYWWACFPGCMPDSELPSGPFDSEEAAIRNANEEG